MRKYCGVIVLWVMLAGVSLAQKDSLRIEKQGEKVFVIHQVASKQTLYSLARRYQTTVTEINQANPALVNGLKVGQTLRIPYGGELPSEKTKEEVSTVREEVIHKVQAGETLFAVARKYDVSVTDIKNWNGLNSNSLALGQEIKVQVERKVENAQGLSEASTKQSAADALDTKTADTAVVNTSLPLDTTSVKETPVPEPETYDGTPFSSYEVEGLAEVIDEEEPSKKFFALHRTAKVGTVIKVKNLMNDLTVYVRVIGTIPETAENENVLIKLNQKAYNHLKALDKRFRVELSYFQ